MLVARVRETERYAKKEVSVEGFECKEREREWRKDKREEGGSYLREAK